MAVLSGQEVGSALCNALGIDPNTVHRLEVVCEPGTAAMLRVEYFIDDGTLDRIVSSLEDKQPVDSRLRSKVQSAISKSKQ